MSRPLDTEKRERIIESAIDEFGRRGFAQTTIREIADHAGISQGGVYTYFSDKEELFLASVRWGWEQFHAGFDRILEAGTSLREAVQLIAQLGFRLLGRFSPLVGGMAHESNRAGILRENLNRIVTRLTDFFLDRSDELPHQFPKDHAVVETQIRIIGTGILFSMAMVPESEYPAEMERIRIAVLDGFFGGAFS